MSRLRTFLAIQSTAEIQNASARLIRRLEAVAPGMHWVDPANLHLTLKFLGDVEDRDLYSICDRVRRVTEQAAEFQLKCHGVGAFPNADRPRTLWMGVDDADEHLQQLHHDLEDTLCELGFPAENRKYRGHFTLGRNRDRPQASQPLCDLLLEYESHEFGVLPVDEVIVYSSELGRGGPTYTVVGRCPLR